MSGPPENMLSGMKLNFIVSSFRKNFLNQMTSLLMSINYDFQGLYFVLYKNNDFYGSEAWIKLPFPNLFPNLSDPGQIF